MPKIALLAAGATAIASTLVALPTGASAATTTKVTIVASNAVKTYGAADPSFGYSVYGLARGDSLTRNPTCTAATHRNVGAYSITCTGAQADPKKYSIAYSAGTLYVGKAILYVAPNYQQRYYGDADPALTYSTYGLVNGDTLSKTPTCAVTATHVNAGRYPISCSGADAGGNYDLRYADNALDVAKRPLLLGPDKQAIYFGMAEPTFTYSTYGLISGDTLTKTPTCGVSAEHVHVGSYQIACTGAEATSNYALSVVANSYTVKANKAVLTADKAAISKNILGQPSSASLRAQLYLTYPYGGVFPNQPLTFTSGDVTLCTNVLTDKDGYAICKLGSNVSTLVKNGSYTVTYAGQGTDIKGDSRTVQN